MTIRTRPATPEYREGWERTFLHPKQEVHNFDKGPAVYWCGRCGHSVEPDDKECRKCGVSFRSKEAMRIVDVNKYTGTITVECKP